jgi:signal transduction histidine kinase
MGSGRGEGLSRTLRFRLTFWNTAVLLLVVGVTLLGLRQALLWTMQRELDHLLAEDAVETALLLRSKYPAREVIQEALDRKARSHSEDEWFVQVFHPDGSLYLSGGSPPPDQEGAFTSSRIPLTLSLDGRRVLQHQVEPAECPRFLVRVGASLAGIEQDVARLTRLLLLAGALIIGVAPLAGYFLAGRATRPLSSILRTTRELRPDHLDERLVVRGTGDELDTLAGTINSFLDRLAIHLRQQREFVAHAAHELRSPLAALRALIETALERERSGEEYRDLLGDLSEECAALGGLVTQLLLLAESDAGQLRPGDTVLGMDQLVQRSVDMFRGVAEQKGVGLELNRLEPVLVRGHASHLRQVIHNLLDNAIKFTPAGGRVSVEVRREPAEGGPGKAVLLIRDDGDGIASEDLPHLFDRFFRGDRARRRGQTGSGSGLGLCICQSIVHAYGGDLHVESSPGAGTTVRVFLPLDGGE